MSHLVQVRSKAVGSESSKGQGDRFVQVVRRSLCPGPNRPLDTKKGWKIPGTTSAPEFKSGILLIFRLSLGFMQGFFFDFWTLTQMDFFT